METVLEVIRASISSDGVPAEREPLTRVTPLQEERLFFEDDDPNWEHHEEQVFDDRGEGAGIEGDLEAGDD
jgi:hypothetical protein